MDRLLRDLQYIKGVGPKRCKQLHRLGLDTVFDLLWNVPRTYLNRGSITPISSLQSGQSASIRGKVCHTTTSRTRGGMVIFKALIEDLSGRATAVWFNQPFIKGIIITGQEVFISGKVKLSYDGLQLQVSEYEVIDDESVHYTIVPVYSLTEGISQKSMRSLTLTVLREYLAFYPEILTKELQLKYNLCSIDHALNNIHFPEGRESYRQARRRLAMEELLLFQFQIGKAERRVSAEGYVVHKEKSELVDAIAARLPFELTTAQKRVVGEIFHDMEAPCPMNRLLQGDVGAGKTVVAAMAVAKAVASGFQTAIMAPTEILAEQHYLTMDRFFSAQGVITARLTGGTTASERRLILQALANGEIDILVGTHALIQDDVMFESLGLAVIDEQHRFGVRQRAALSRKGTAPDVLVMTATPIPRTLALTVYGDLSLSVIDQLPPNRKAVKTRVVNPEHRLKVYHYVKEQVTQGAQAYIVCPLVEESENQDMQAAASLYEELATDLFSNLKVGLIHGRLKSAEKDLIMQRFKQGQIQVLVSTSVVEVGVDVPNASVMVIEQAERFGLSQLHQLRGRVGRGKLQSYCFLIAQPKNDEAIQRLKVIESTTDGFQLAEEDLKIRGPGEFWGVRQHGLDSLKVANLSKDQKLVEISRQLSGEYLFGHNDMIMNKYISLKFSKSNQVAPN